jgi:hypothetical protein
MPSGSKTSAPPKGGLILAPLEGGVWAAIEALRGAMIEEREQGNDPRVASFSALTRDGRLVGGRDPDAAVFALEYRIPPA